LKNATINKIKIVAIIHGITNSSDDSISYLGSTAENEPDLQLIELEGHYLPNMFWRVGLDEE